MRMRRWSALIILAAAWTGAAAQEAKKDPPKTEEKKAEVKKAEPKKVEPKKEEPKKVEEGPLYPLTIGSRWTYAVGGQTTDLVITAARKEKIGDVECVVLESTRDGKVVASECVAIVGDDIKRFRFAALDITPPLTFAKSAMKKGDAWEAAYSLTVEKEKVDTKIKYLVDTEKVKVPAGEYDTVSVGGKMDEGETKLWFAKGVGAVKMYFDLGEGGKITLELKNADVKK